jgi:DNA-binding response OmpR family regulator
MKKILVCDDDQVTLNVIVMKLRANSDWQITTAQDGQEAIASLSSETFDLVITDMQMPFKSGIDVVTHIRKVQRLKTPIIILSSEGMEHIVIQAFELGVNDYMTKPCNAADLVIKVKALLK